MKVKADDVETFEQVWATPISNGVCIYILTEEGIEVWAAILDYVVELPCNIPRYFSVSDVRNTSDSNFSI